MDHILKDVFDGLVFPSVNNVFPVGFGLLDHLVSSLLPHSSINSLAAFRLLIMKLYSDEMQQTYNFLFIYRFEFI